MLSEAKLEQIVALWLAGRWQAITLGLVWAVVLIGVLLFDRCGCPECEGTPGGCDERD